MTLLISSNVSISGWGWGEQSAVIPIYRRMCRFSCLLHLIILFVLNNQLIPTFSILISLQDNCLLVTKTTPTNFLKRVPRGRTFQDNIEFTTNLILWFSLTLPATWLLIPREGVTSYIWHSTDVRAE